MEMDTKTKLKEKAGKSSELQVQTVGDLSDKKTTS